MTPFKQTQLDFGLFTLRVGLGIFMLVHGIQKIQGFSDGAASFPDPLGVGNQLSMILAIASEVGCSALLILGAATRLAALPLAFTMIVACFLVHAEDPWKVRELSAIYLLGYVVVFLTGPGRMSIDHRFFGRSKVAESP